MRLDRLEQLTWAIMQAPVVKSLDVVEKLRVFEAYVFEDGGEYTDGPNKKWAVDISYIWTAEGWLYLAVVMDVRRENDSLDRFLIRLTLKADHWVGHVRSPEERPRS